MKVALYVDKKYNDWTRVEDLLSTLKEGDGVCTLANGEAAVKLKSMARQRRLGFYAYEAPEWDAGYGSDPVFLYYLYLNNISLHIYPHKFNIKTYGANYSKRVQDLVIDSHFWKVKIEIHNEVIHDSKSSLSIGSSPS